MAEDEDVIRASIIAKIKELDSEFEIVGQARDGQAALNAVSELNPQVVFTDIKMPEMDGMELIRRLSLSYPTVKIVVLSGYGDFSYTKQAIKYSVFNYLLKPIENDALLETLHDLKSAIASYEYMQNRRVVYSSNYITHKDIACRYALFAVCIGNLCYDVSDKFLSQDYEQLQAAINWHEILGSVYPTSIDWYLSDEEEKNQKLICFSIAENSTEDFAQMATKLAAQLSAACNGVPVTLCACVQAFVEKDVWVCARRMRNIIKQKLIIGEGNVFILETDEGTASGDILGIVKMRVNDSLRTAIEHEDAQAVKSELTLIFKYIIDNRVPQHDVQHILLYILRIFEFSGKKQTEIAQTEVLRCLSSTLQSEKIVSQLLHIIMEMMFANSDPVDDSDTLAKQLLKYIEENFIKLDNLEDITKEFQYNYSYLSRLFKKECNVSISRYVLTKRMELAKCMIENNEGLSITQIAQLTGYADSHYFSRAFKMYEGITPTEYKNSVILKG